MKKYATYFKLSKILDKILKFYWNKYISYIFQKKYFFSEKIKFEFHYYFNFKNFMQQNKQIPDGQRTKVIYTLIKDAKYSEV